LAALVRSSFGRGLGPSPFAEMIRTLHLRRFEQHHAQYLEMVELRLPYVSPGILTLHEPFGAWDDPDGYAGFVPSHTYFRGFYDCLIERYARQIDQKMAMNQQTIQGQQQSAQQSAQMAQQLAQMDQQFKMAQIQLQGQFDVEVAKIKVGMAAQVADQTNQVKMAGHIIAAQSKENDGKRKLGVPEEQIPPLMPQQGQDPSQGVGMEQNIPEEAMQ